MRDFVTEFASKSIGSCLNISSIDFSIDYEAFLDSQISGVDQNYLQDSDIAREFIELGYRGVGHVITRQDFQERKHRAELVLHSRRQGPVPIISETLTITEPFAKALAIREEANRMTRLLTIIFIRDRNHLSQEISAYIDYAYRLKVEDLTSVFLGENKLIPSTNDLSFYNWDTHMCTSNDTNNFRLLPDVNGIRFRCEHDRKIIYVDPESEHYGDGTTRTILNTSGYLQIILYVNFIPLFSNLLSSFKDHHLRRKKF